MKRFYLSSAGALILFFSLLPILAQEHRTEVYQPVPLKNAGFEEKELGPWVTKRAVLDYKFRRSGQASLKLENRNPGQYELIRQKIAVKPGELLRFGGWVKGENVSTEELWREKGAGIFVQGYSADDKYIAGEFAPTLSGTFGWQEVKGMYLVPPGVDYLYFGLFIRNRNTGIAWFDDLWLEKKEGDVAVSTLRYPNYRGMTTATSKVPWEVEVEGKGLVNAYFKTQITNGKGDVFFTDSVPLTLDTSQVIRWSPNRRLKTGDYIWAFKLFDGKGAEMDAFLYHVTVRRRMPKVYIDHEGFTVKNGQRIFPLGIYLGEGPRLGSWASSGENLDKIAEAGFNTVLSYYFGDRDTADEFFALTRERGLEVVYNLKDIYDGGQDFRKIGPSAATVSEALVQKLKNQPNLLAWYINDELGLGKLPAIQQRYDDLQTQDSNHPAFQVNDKTELLPFFYNSYDIIGTDPYPVANSKSLKQVSDWTREAMDASKKAKGVWQVLQLHDLSFHNNKTNRPPTLDEMRNMSYQALIGGAKGLYYFAYHWLYYGRDAAGKRAYSEKAFDERWPDIKSLIAEMNEVTPVITGGRRLPIQSEFNGIKIAVWNFREQNYILVANPEQIQQTVHIKLAQAPKVRKTHFSTDKIKSSEAGITVSVGAFESGILVLDEAQIIDITL